MPDLKISQLPATVTVTDADLVETVQGGTNKQTTALQLKSYLGLVGTPISIQSGVDISTNLYPSTGGTFTGGVPGAGNIFPVTVGGNLNGGFVPAGALLLSLVNMPGQTNSNWRII